MTNHVWFQNGAPRWRFQPLIAARMDPQMTVVRMVRFHGFWCSYSWSSWNTPIYANIAFMKHTKRLFVRLINSCAVHTFHFWGYLIAPVDFWWDTDLSVCEMPAFCTHQNPSVENNSYMICAHFLQLNLAEKGGRCGSASAPVPPIVCLSAGGHCCGTERGCQRLSEAINRWQSWSSSTCSLSLSTSYTNVPVRLKQLDWFTLSFLQEKPMDSTIKNRGFTIKNRGKTCSFSLASQPTVLSRPMWQCLWGLRGRQRQVLPKRCVKKRPLLE